jgi:hypothetical protein
MLSFSEYSRENKFLDHATIALSVQFYLQGDINRMPLNIKDVIKITDELVSVRSSTSTWQTKSGITVERTTY